MGKMSELAAQLSELKRCGEILIGISESLTELLGGDVQQEEKADTGVAEKTGTVQKPITLEEVRAVLAEKSRNGHTAEVRELLIKHGANKLSEIDPAKYPVLLKDAEVL